jgi:hypothetical protein
MPGVMNEKIDFNCHECGEYVPANVRDNCWTGQETQDHNKLCCDCYDLTFGMKPKIKINVKTSADWFSYKEYD